MNNECALWKYQRVDLNIPSTAIGSLRLDSSYHQVPEPNIPPSRSLHQQWANTCACIHPQHSSNLPPNCANVHNHSLLCLDLAGHQHDRKVSTAFAVVSQTTTLSCTMSIPCQPSLQCWRQSALASLPPLRKSCAIHWRVQLYLPQHSGEDVQPSNCCGLNFLFRNRLYLQLCPWRGALPAILQTVIPFLYATLATPNIRMHHLK